MSTTKTSPIINILNEEIKDLKDKRLSIKSTEVVLKERLQLYVLEFLFNSSKYSNLKMYGGTLLRIVYDLPRMSEDIDLQSSKDLNLKELDKDIKEYFSKNYNLELESNLRENSEVETKTMTLKFNILDQLDFENNNTKLHLKIDVNYFPELDKLPTERKVITNKGHHFSINTYPISCLMSSKILALLNRSNRGMGKKKIQCKPRDVFDVKWYLDQNIIPDIEYLELRGESFNNIKELLEKIKIRVGNLTEEGFAEDLKDLILSEDAYNEYISNESWKKLILEKIDTYRFKELVKIEKILVGKIQQNIFREQIHYLFIFQTSNGGKFKFEFKLTDYWLESNIFCKLNINDDLKIEDGIKDLMEYKKDIIPSNTHDFFIKLFYEKIEDYMDRYKNIIQGNIFETKILRTTPDNINPKEELYLTPDYLKKSQLEELA